MLYYFSGTGNSKLVCELLAAQTKDEFCPMTAPIPCSGSSLGIVFPVYAWGMPNLVNDFIKHKLSELIGHNVGYLYVVMTCGDDVGYTDTLVRRALHVQGLSLNAVFSIQMPNTYICLPGFDVDIQEVVDAKLKAMRQHIPAISAQILARHNVVNVHRGMCAHIKTYILRPLFNCFLIDDRRFRVDYSLCTHCGKCIKQCPVSNMTMSDKNTIQWSNTTCTGCLGCYHACPHNAIQYGPFSKGKGQKRL